MKAPIAIALDAPSLEIAINWASQVEPYVSTLKIGLETYLRDGKIAILKIREKSPSCGIFLDLKLHDIPATVKGACKSVADLNPKYLTVHASGGADMISQAAEILPNTFITAVTILTSLNDSSLQEIGFKENPHQAAVNLASLAVSAGARAIVCSPNEVASIRKAVGDDVVLITPGVRPIGSKTDDQQRVATPNQALDNGADLLVIGRPITAAAVIEEAAQQISHDILQHLNRDLS